MLKNDVFTQQFRLLAENFNFNFSVEYQLAVFEAIKSITNERMIETTKGVMLSTTMKDWNEAYGFKGKPAVADWIEVFLPKIRKKITKFDEGSAYGYDAYELVTDFGNNQRKLKNEK